MDGSLVGMSGVVLDLLLLVFVEELVSKEREVFYEGEG